MAHDTHGQRNARAKQLAPASLLATSNSPSLSRASLDEVLQLTDSRLSNNINKIWIFTLPLLLWAKQARTRSCWCPCALSRLQTRMWSCYLLLPKVVHLLVQQDLYFLMTTLSPLHVSLTFNNFIPTHSHSIFNLFILFAHNTSTFIGTRKHKEHSFYWDILVEDDTRSNKKRERGEEETAPKPVNPYQVRPVWVDPSIDVTTLKLGEEISLTRIIPTSLRLSLP